MQVKNFECQIARAQITRYLAGEPLTEDMIGQLEAHVAKCADCKQVLNERKMALQALVTPQPKKIYRTAVVEVEEDAEPEASARQTLSQRLVGLLPKPKAESSKSLGKPAVYAAGLAVVLIAMSYFSKNFGSIMGPKAAQTLPQQSSPEAVVSLDSKPPAKPVVQVPKPTPKPLPKILKPVVQLTARPLPTAPKPASRRSARRIKTASPSTSRSEDTIRVYPTH